MTCAVAEAVWMVVGRMTLLTVKIHGKISIRATVLGLVGGSMVTIIEPYYSLEMVLRACFSISSLWTVAFVRELVWRHQQKSLHDFLQVTHNHPRYQRNMAITDAIFLSRYYFGGYCGDYEQQSTTILQRVQKTDQGLYWAGLWLQSISNSRWNSSNYVSMKHVRIPYLQAIIAFLEKSRLRRCY